MAKKKRKKLDQFLDSRKQSQEAALEERTQLSNRLFRFCVGSLVVLLLLYLYLAGNEKLSVGLVLGMGLLFAMLAGLGTYTVHRLSPRLFQGAGSFNRFVILIVATVFAYKGMLSLGWSPYLTPLPVLGMVVGMAYPQVVGVLIVLPLAFYFALLVPGGGTPEAGAAAAEGAVPLVDLPRAVAFGLGGTICVLGVARVRRQSRPVVVGLNCGVFQAAAIICFQLLGDQPSLQSLQGPNAIEPQEFLKRFLEDPGYGFAAGIICGGIVTSILPVIETAFGIVSERRLLELADPSNKLLQVLRERAPGTFQHTLGVQQLAGAAAEAIGADVLVAEVGAYYHDIGKIEKPGYFVENMGEDKTIHDSLRPSMSKMIIISHVKDGIVLAREEKLPAKIIDMIPMHHGTTVVEFFYRKARKQSREEEAAPGEDVEYRYPGPKPRFQEAGILMLADAVEAIAKTMAEPSSNRFRDMVRELVMNRLEDGQLDECNLTIAHLRKIEDSFVRKLTTMYHSRIDYSVSDDASVPEPVHGASKPESSKVGEPVKGTKAP